MMENMKVLYVVLAGIIVLAFSVVISIGNTQRAIDAGRTAAAQQSVATSPHPMKVKDPAMYPILSLTPGALNPAVTQETIAATICKKGWSTKSVRDTQSTPAQKQTRYRAYEIAKPAHNTGQNQTCELDHLISLELGGGDALENIWPECGPSGVPLNQRYFKEKDAVENYLHAQVCSGAIPLDEAQKEIVQDWYAVYQRIAGDQ